jgi:WD40 repeat protein
MLVLKMRVSSLFHFFIILLSSSELIGQEIVPKLVIPSGHSEVSSAIFNPNGELILTVGDHSAKIWDAQTGKLLHSLEGLTGRVRYTAFSPDGKHVLAQEQGKSAKVWDIRTGNLMYNLEGYQRPVEAYLSTQMVGIRVLKGRIVKGDEKPSFSADGKRIVTCMDSENAQVWDAQTGELIHNLEGHSPKFSPNVNRIVIASDTSAQVWDAQTGELIHNLEGRAPMFSPDGVRIVTTASDSTAKVWDAQTGELIHNLEGRAPMFSPDGVRIVTTASDSTAKVWDAQTGELIHNLKGHASSVRSAKFSTDGVRIVTTASNSTAKVWDAQTGELISSLDGSSNSVRSAEFGLDRVRIVTTGSDSTAKVWWDGYTEELIRFFEESYSQSELSAEFSPDGKYILTEKLDWGSAKVWDAETGNLLYSFEDHTPRFSPDGNRIVITSGASTQVWDMNTGGLLFTLSGYTENISTVSYSSSSKEIIVKPGEPIREPIEVYYIKELSDIYEHFRMSNKGSILCPDLNYNCLSSDGRNLLAPFECNVVGVWNANTGELLFRLEGHTDLVFDASFDPDGDHLITSSKDNSVKVWNAHTGIMLFSLEEEAVLYSARFLHNGETILTTTSDGAAVLWETQSGRRIIRLNEAGRALKSVDFSPDRDIIVTTTVNNYPKVWDVRSGRLIRQLDLVGGEFVSFSPDGSSFLIQGQNSVMLWDASSMKKLYTRLQYKDNDWLVHDEHFRYDGSPGARERLHFVCGLEIIELNQLKDALYVPGLASKIMNGEDINFPKLSDLEICDVFPEIESMPEDEHYFRFRIQPRKIDVQSIEVWLNNKRVRIIPASEVHVGPEGMILELLKSDFEPLFVPGEDNSLKVNAVVDLMNTEARSRGQIVLRRRSRKNSSSPRLFALMIGVSDYKDASLNLHFAAKDAIDIGSALELSAKKFLGQDLVHMYFVHSRPEKAVAFTTPEKEGVRKALKEIGRLAQPEDVLIIFFAGHGVVRPGDGRFTLLTADASSLLPIGITTEELMDWISPEGPHSIKANKAILIFDACHSGLGAEEIVGWAQRNDDETQRLRQLDDLSDKAGMYILAASSANQSAYELKQYQQGLLTYSLLYTLQNNSRILDDDRFLNVQKWFLDSEQYLQQIVRELGLKQQSQPYGSANIRIGVVDDEVRSTIRLVEVRPVLYCAVAINSTTATDDLEIKRALNQILFESSDRNYGATIGNYDIESSLAYRINVAYEIVDGILNARASLLRGKELIHRINTTGDPEDLSEMINEIAGKFLSILE